MKMFVSTGDFSEKDLGLIKDFFENKFKKIISTEEFEKFLNLSAGQHEFLENGENPFIYPKPSRYFNGPFLDIKVEIGKKFSVDNLRIPAPASKCFNKNFFPQEDFYGEKSTAQLQIVSTKEALTREEITKLVDKELKGSKNLSKFLIRVVSDVVPLNDLFDQFAEQSNIIIPLISKSFSYKDAYPVPLFWVTKSIKKEIGIIWSYNWANYKVPADAYVALLFQ